VHQLVNKNLDKIRMHGTNVGGGKHTKYATHRSSTKGQVLGSVCSFIYVT